MISETISESSNFESSSTSVQNQEPLHINFKPKSMTQNTLQPSSLGKQLTEDPLNKNCLSPLKLANRQSHLIKNLKPMVASSPRILR
jgi:hypothetical protein